MSLKGFGCTLWGCHDIATLLTFGIKLGKSFPQCKQMQIREDRCSGLKFFRLRALVPLKDHLHRCLRVSTPNGLIHPALVRYERLPTICFIFFCGRIGHRYRECSLNVDNVFVVDMVYGSWMGGVDSVASVLIDEIIGIGQNLEEMMTTDPTEQHDTVGVAPMDGQHLAASQHELDSQRNSNGQVSHKRSTGILQQDGAVLALEPFGKRIKTPTVVAVTQPRRVL